MVRRCPRSFMTRLAALPAGSYGHAMPSFSHDGVEIAFLDEGEGEPIVLVHGFASNKEVNWETCARATPLEKANSTAAQRSPVRCIRSSRDFVVVPSMSLPAARRNAADARAMTNGRVVTSTGMPRATAIERTAANVREGANSGLAFSMPAYLLRLPAKIGAMTRKVCLTDACASCRGVPWLPGSTLARCAQTYGFMIRRLSQP